MKDIIIFDMDGTLSDCEHRRHFVTGRWVCPEGSDCVAQHVDTGHGLFCNTHNEFLRKKKKDWDGFFSQMPLDPPNEAIVAMAQSLGRGPYLIYVVTGRFEKYRQVTMDWLAKHEVRYHGLYMRKTDDHREDFVVKREILHNNIGKENVLFVVDDRASVVRMWREEGLTCLQCAEGNF